METPKIVDDIVEFIKFFDNPDREEGEFKSIKEIQLRIYDVSMSFYFKWYIPYEQLKEVSEFTNVKIENDTLSLSLGEYNIELSKKED